MNKLPDIHTAFSEWYQDVITQAELADQAPVRGSIVIRPYGYAIWERIRDRLDERIKETGHQNAAFPLLIPESFLKKEAEHIEGFSPELAIVTYAGGKKLEEPLVIRPTSETIVHYMFAKWIKSWRDLPLKINQWANVIRWEMRPRTFLRTTEFFWQEGHTAHETYDEAEQEALLMLKEYTNILQDYLAIPLVAGIKSEGEKFPGAEKTYTLETLMPDGKALQLCTSHLLSHNFAKSFDMAYQDKSGNIAYPHLTSWGATTRLIGALIMVHGDKKGLVLPPKIAPIQVVIIPIVKGDSDRQQVLKQTISNAERLRAVGIRVEIDDDEQKTPGAKFYKWELKGVPLRIEIGPRDIANGQVVLVDRLGLEKKSVPLDLLEAMVHEKLEQVQKVLFDQAEKKLKGMWHQGEKLIHFGPVMEKDGGFYQTGWCKNAQCEAHLKKYKATIRCLLPEQTMKECFNCSNKSVTDVLVAKSY